MITSPTPAVAELPSGLTPWKEPKRQPFDRYLGSLSAFSAASESINPTPDAPINIDQKLHEFIDDYFGSRALTFIGADAEEKRESFEIVRASHKDSVIQAGRETLAAAGDTDTPGHQDRVTGLVSILRDRILNADPQVLHDAGISSEELELLRNSELMTLAPAIHDVGKHPGHIQDRIKKRGEITADDRRVVATHTVRTTIFLLEHSSWAPKTTMEVIKLDSPHHSYDDRNLGRAAKGKYRLAAQLISWADQLDAISSDMFSGRPYKRTPIKRVETIATLYGQFTGEYRDLFMAVSGFDIPHSSETSEPPDSALTMYAGDTATHKEVTLV
jgi:hypothetical protein